jgi:dTDP-glucose 4,6-dehydratase
MKTVLLSGGAGFIGSNLVAYLLKHTDWQITIIDRLDHSGNLNRLAEIGAHDNPRVRFMFHDLRAAMNDQVAQQIGRHDYIVHLAAGTHVDRSITDPMAFVLDNVVATCNILDFAKRTGCEKFVQFSTDEVFGPAPEGVKYKENDRYNSGNPYAATKAGAEELAVSFHNTYGLPVIVTHTMNVIGPMQNPEKFVPMTIAKVNRGETVLIHSNKEKTKAGSRFYIEAEEVARALVLLLDRGVPGEKYNIVGSEEIDNLDLAQRIAIAIGKRLKYEMLDFHSQRPGHDLRYALDGSKMKLMGFTPRPIDLAGIVTWYLGNADQWLDAGIQIEAA